MRCCRCREEMLVVEYAQIEIDYCADCGIWLDSGELELILEETGEPGGGDSSPAVVEHDDKPIRCPVCRTKMKKGPYDKLAHSIVDRCPKDHGIWLDRGELREIVETRASDNAADRTAAHPFVVGSSHHRTATHAAGRSAAATRLGSTDG